MAIKIIKEPIMLFTMHCPRCESIFTYEPEDLLPLIAEAGKENYCVKCPTCTKILNHDRRERSAY